jgi:hypothetical protein
MVTNVSEECAVSVFREDEDVAAGYSIKLVSV